MRRTRINRERLRQALAAIGEEFEFGGKFYRFDARPVLRVLDGAKEVTQRVSALAILFAPRLDVVHDHVHALSGLLRVR